MVKVVGIRFRKTNKIYYFNPESIYVRVGDGVIVETIRGIEYGTVVSPVKKIKEEELVTPLKPILRLATEEDKEIEAENREKEKAAFDVCLEKIAKNNLVMKLVDVEYTFDRNKITFYFTADGRVDFRELVKDLAYVYKTRIELRQIGARDEAKAIGGLGICGRECCCKAFQNEFQPVSIRMAKDQNLSLNPVNISGACGRLMCCIKYEEETYLELNKKLPRPGDTATTEDGYPCVVDSVNTLRQKVKVIVDLDNDEREAREYKAGDLKFIKKRRKKDNNEEKMSAEELKELEKLEKE